MRAPPIDAGRETRSRDVVERASSGMARWYETLTHSGRHQAVRWPALVFAVWVAMRLGGHVPVVALSPPWFVSGVVLTAFLTCRRVVAAVVAVAAAVVLGAHAWHHITPPAVGACDGVIRLIDDPVTSTHVARVVVELHGVRYDARSYGRHSVALARINAGEAVIVRARCSSLSARDVAYSRPRHVLGRMTIIAVGDRRDSGSALSRSALWVRTRVAQGARTMGAAEQSLFTGLVIGDDARQPRAMVEAFRASGLGHLCAVSGQNVAYVLVAFSFLLRRLRPMPRLVATILVVGWFVVVTRVEPSVVRAGAMAIATEWTFHRGSGRTASDVLAISSLAALFVDPMLAWSVGFLLSVSASLGLVTLSAPLGRVIPSPLAHVLAPALAAQVATAPVALSTFGQLPIIALAANCIATPLAGVVMLVGLPVTMVAAHLPDVAARLCITPLEILVRVVWWTATVAESISPHGAWNVGAWSAVLVVVVWRVRRRSVTPLWQPM